MHIKKVTINDIYSFHNFEIELDNLQNIIVGTNGCGKTNFLEIIDNVIMSLDNKNKDPFENITSNGKVIILIKFNDEEIKFLKAIYIFSCLAKMTNRNVQYKWIITEIMKLNFFPNEITISYEKKRIYDKTCIKFNCCTCDTNYCNKEDCEKNQITNIFGVLYNNRQNQNKNTELNSMFEKLKIPDFNNQHIDTINNMDEISYFVEIINGNPDIFKILYNGKTICNIIETPDDEKITWNNLQKIIPHSKNFNEILKKYIINNSKYLCLEKCNSAIDIIRYMEKYEDDFSSIKNQLPTLKTIYQSNLLYNFISNICNEYNIKNNLYFLKNNSRETFKKIQQTFTQVTQKNFDIILHKNGTIHDYTYVIRNDNNEYDCSYGENELINFLCNYYGDNYDIILIDEPCSHLSSQNKNHLKNILKNEKKQLICVTHDIELIDDSQNLIHFRMENNTTNNININILFQENDQQKLKKNIFDHPELLFSDKILFVEGYSDYRFMKEFCQIFNINDYKIIIMDGCKNNNIWEICEKLKIQYKIIYDFDVLQSNNKTEETYNQFAQKFLDGHKIIFDFNYESVIMTEQIILNYFDYELPFIHFNCFLNVVDNLMFDNKLNNEFKKQYTNKTLNIWTKKDKTNEYKIEITDNSSNILKNIKYSDFLIKLNDKLQSYNICYKEEWVEFIRNHKDDFKNTFDKIIKNNIILDDIINEAIKTKKIFIWKIEYKNLEGIAQKIFNNTQFQKDDWQKTSSNYIFTNIINNKNHKILHQLNTFLTNN